MNPSSHSIISSGFRSHPARSPTSLVQQPGIQVRTPGGRKSCPSAYTAPGFLYAPVIFYRKQRGIRQRKYTEWLVVINIEALVISSQGRHSVCDEGPVRRCRSRLWFPGPVHRPQHCLSRASAGRSTVARTSGATARPSACSASVLASIPAQSRDDVFGVSPKYILCD